MTKERGIIFSDEEVRATLDMRKSQFRRVVKQRPDTFYRDEPCKHSWPAKRCGSICSDCWAKWLEVCPWGVGDRVYVKEVWKPLAVYPPYTAPFGCEVPSDNGWETEDWEGPAPKVAIDGCAAVFRATYDEEGPWRSPAIMPKWASRITLEITGVRIERLQDIRPCDVQAEGCPYTYSGFDPEEAPDWSGWYREIWDRIHAKKPGQSWAENAWTWVLEFKRVQP